MLPSERERAEGFRPRQFPLSSTLTSFYSPKDTSTPVDIVPRMVSRREYLHACSAGALGALAGCTAGPLAGSEKTATPEIVKATNVHHRSGFGASISTDGDLLVVGAPQALTRAHTWGGTAFIYEREDDSWVKTARLRPPGEDLAGPIQDERQLSFGSYVAAEDGTVVVGTSLNGAAYTFERSGSGWTREQTIRPDAEAVADEQRYPNEVAVDGVLCADLSFDGETLVLSASAGLAEASGMVQSVHVFERGGGGWREVAAFARETPTELDHYGYSTAVDGDTVVASGTEGGEGDGAFQSVLYTFERGGGGWQKAGTLHPESAIAGSGLRRNDSLVLSGSTFAVGGLNVGEDEHGVVDVYGRDGDEWGRQARLSPEVPGALRTIGAELALDDGTLIAGAPSVTVDTNIEGTAFRYERDGQEWTFERRYTEGNAVYPGEFGRSVALSADQVTVGGLIRRDALADRPCVYVFPR